MTNGPGDTPAVRVVVAGVGAVTAQGPTAQDLWEGVSGARVAIGPVVGLRLTGHPVSIGAQVASGPHLAATGDRLVDMAIRAGAEALGQSGVGLDTIPAGRWAVVMASCRPGICPDWVVGDERSLRLAPALMPQGIVEQVGCAFGFTGPAVAIDTACAGGANALGYAADLIRLGHADAALAGGSEVLSDLTFAGFNCVEALSPEPAAPYSRNRKGLSLGEGSAMLVLLRADLGEKLGVGPLAELLGYGLSADGYHPTAPDPSGEGAARAIIAALDASGVRAAEVAYVNGHGTGTPKNDVAETKAIRRALGPVADRVVVSSTKSMIGHLLGAAGAAEAAVTTLAVHHQVVPPTAGYADPDPACDLDYVPWRARPLSVGVAVSNSFGFGGANACLVLGQPGRGAPHTMVGPEPIVVTGMFAECGPPVSSACERLEPDWSPFLSPKLCRRLDRLSIFAVVAAGRALHDAGLDLDRDGGERVGVIFATALGPHEAVCDFQGHIVRDGPAAANPAAFPNIVRSAAPGCVATHLGIRGPLSTVVSGHAAGAIAIGYAADIVRRGDAGAMVVAAADTLTPIVLAAYRDLGLLAPAEGGFSLAESLAGLVLEPLSRARARGARIYGQVLGYGLASDGRPDGGIDPEGRSIERAMSGALRHSGRRRSEVGAVWSSAADRRAADGAEAGAIRRLFNDVTVWAPKMAFGEVLGASAPILCRLALQQRHMNDFPTGLVTLVNASSLGGSHASVALGAVAPG